MSDGEMIYRTLGRTGERVSAIGLGGFHIGTLEEKSDAIASFAAPRIGA
jgi:aryl-alcohol dehydrogenase-like predicted oxidoreductase